MRADVARAAEAAVEQGFNMPADSVAQLGLFRQDDLNLAELGRNQAKAQLIYDMIGYE